MANGKQWKTTQNFPVFRLLFNDKESTKNYKQRSYSPKKKTVDKRVNQLIISAVI